ncbi:MAG: hypothetical protein VW268_00805 [Rhodospirillaceae bacterium]
MKRAFVSLLLIALAGCEVIAADGVTVMATQKTLLDHAVSVGSGKNCSTIRRERGLSYCVEDEKKPKMNVYCYRTLGEVTCYDKPVRDGQQERVGQGGEIPK